MQHLRLVFQLDTAANLLGARDTFTQQKRSTSHCAPLLFVLLSSSWSVHSAGQRISTSHTKRSSHVCFFAPCPVPVPSASSAFSLPSWKYYSKFLAYLEASSKASWTFRPERNAVVFPRQIIISYYIFSVFCHKCKLAMRNLHIQH